MKAIKNKVAVASLMGLLMGSAMFFQNCAEPFHDVGSAGSSGLGANSVLIFETTVYPIVSQNCGGCHGLNQSPLFAVNDIRTSHDSLVNFGLVSLSTPSTSRIVAKIREGHQAFPSTLADSLQAAIVAWAEEVQRSGGGTGVTPPKLEAKFSSIHNLILVPKCVGCHSPNGERPQEDYSTYETTRRTGDVTAGNAQDSGLYTECASGEMPENAPNLSAEELTAIRDWINSGAPNN